MRRGSHDGDVRPPFPSPALEVPQDVGDDFILGTLVLVPDRRWQLGDVRLRVGCLGGLSRALLSGYLWERCRVVTPVILAN